jgi:hypothetical protein
MKNMNDSFWIMRTLPSGNGDEITHGWSMCSSLLAPQSWQQPSSSSSSSAVSVLDLLYLNVQIFKFVININFDIILIYFYIFDFYLVLIYFNYFSTFVQ